MTGKDFSGPVPEIRAPPPMPMVPPSETLPEDTDDIPSTSYVMNKRRRSKSQGTVESGVVIIGEAENFES
jgi:transcription factor TFIIIB component B''